MRHTTLSAPAPRPLVIEAPSKPLVGTLLAIDPGRDQGWSVYSAGALCACGLGDVPADYARPRYLVVEIPDRQEPGVPLSDIVTLALSAGRQLERYGTRAGENVWTVFPCQWKGNANKDITAGLVWATLAPAEAGILRAALAGIRAESKHHNVVDAVRIGWVWTRRVAAMAQAGRIQTVSRRQP